MNRKSLWLVTIAGLASILIWLAFFWTPQSAQGNRPHQRLDAESTAPGGDFTLRGPDGPVSLADQRGKVVLLYFGYTFCPDVCPTSLVLVAQALGALSPEERQNVRAYFISVDPERDTPEVMRAYAPFFHPAIIGLTGSPQEIAAVSRLYGARYMKQKSVDGAPYAVDHSSYTYVIGPDGKLAGRLPHAAPSSDIVALIRARLPVSPVK